MAVTQEISARLGARQAVACRQHPASLSAVGRPRLYGLLLLANVINLGADLGSMGAVSDGGRWPAMPYVLAFGLICIVMQVLLEYARYSRF
jgi:hypothetical protein